ncbi:inorganic pyrophosphatase [Thozetella sp. PMI_491]|nr:inorganic pyrophosphatase [Thozetella sp. PMI_491]
MLAKNALVPLLLSSPAIAATVSHRATDDTSEFLYADLSVREVGARNTVEWRVWLERKGKIISPWHDVPLYPDPSKKNIVNFVVEIPRWTDGKIETKRDEPMNPLFHDTKKGKPRFVESVWPRKTYPIVYGSIPQTWENPDVIHELTGYPGDNDPIDIFDIGVDPGYTGQVRQVKILGGLAMIDDDKTDWKIIAINVNDTLAAYVNTVEDVEKYRPGVTQDMYEWFKYYKVARGNPINVITGEAYQAATTIVDVIEQSHGWWNSMIHGELNGGEINFNQTSTRSANVSYVSACSTTKKFNLPTKSDIQPAVAKPEEYNWWYYLNSDWELITVP